MHAQKKLDFSHTPHITILAALRCAENGNVLSLTQKKVSFFPSSSWYKNLCACAERYVTAFAILFLGCATRHNVFCAVLRSLLLVN
jgi:hypothetical protein